LFHSAFIVVNLFDQHVVMVSPKVVKHIVCLVGCWKNLFISARTEWHKTGTRCTL